MGLSLTHALLLVAVAVILFGRGKISDLMGDFAKGLRNFKTGIAENDREPLRVVARKPVDIAAITDRRNV